MTGSSSKGCTGKKYFYYHCKCGFRVKAEEINELFAKELKKFLPKLKYVESCAVIINKWQRDLAQFKKDNLKNINDLSEETGAILNESQEKVFIG